MTETFAGPRLKDTQRMIFCHRTDPKALCQFDREFPGICQHGHAGMVIKFGE